LITEQLGTAPRDVLLDGLKIDRHPRRTSPGREVACREQQQEDGLSGEGQR